MPERRAELLSAVSEQLHIVGPARTGNVSDAVVEQVFGPPTRYRRGSVPGRRSALAGMTRDRVAAVKLRILHRIEFD